MDIVEKFCGFLAPDWGEFLDFIHLKGKIFHGGTVRRRAGRPEVAPGGLRRDFSGSGQRDFPGTPDVGNRGTTERDFSFVPRWRSSCGTLRETYNNRSGSQRRTAGSAD